MPSIFRPFTVALLAAGAGIALGALASEARRTPALPVNDVHEFVIRAGDFSFDGPRTAPAGLTRIRLINQGPSFHHVQLVRLDPGHTYEEFLGRLAAREFALPWATFVGGPDSPDPKGESEATLLLTEGEYAVICLISGADHTPHVAKGMSFPLTVTAPRAPVADVRMVLREYDFDITPELRTGRQVIRVENAGSQTHHVAIVRLGAGRSAADALHWFRDMVGDPPDESVGGTSGMAPGLVNYITVDLTPGRYALICFVPDEKDGQSHARHGMLRELRVR